MDCTDCGACCVDQHIPLNHLEMLTTPAEEMDGCGRLKKVNGHCIRFDPITRRCSDYENRPQVCRDFKPGCGRCHLMRTWADAKFAWFTERRPIERIAGKDRYVKFRSRITATRDNNGNLVYLSVDEATAPELEAAATTIAALPSNGW